MFWRTANNNGIVRLPNGVALGENFQGPYSSCVAGKYILKLALQQGISDIGPVKLNKLVFIAHGLLLGLTKGKRSLVNEEAEVWKSGPAFPLLYYALEGTFDSVTDVTMETTLDLLEDFVDIDADTAEATVLQYTCEQYGKRNKVELINMTSKSGTPCDTSLNWGSLTIHNRIISLYYANGL